MSEIPVEQITQALAELGDTEQEVVTNLRHLNIKGQPGSACYCPIAVYLKNKLSTSNIAVTPFYVLVNGVATPNPKAVCNFIITFDRSWDLYDLRN